MMYTRREVLRTVAMAGGSALLVGRLGGLRGFAQSTLPKRRSLVGMPLNDPDLATYRDFVGLMKSKNQQQSLSWLGYANQHGSLTGGYKYCPHGNWYFLPWHREFVLMYERAARVLTGNSRFAMPYWDWTLERTLPRAFADRTYQGKPNPLYVPNRNKLTGANALTDELVGKDEVIDKIYAETNYEMFGTTRPAGQNSLDPNWVTTRTGHQGILERTPHNNVHNNIGAFMPTPASPRDPIFMMHHGNIDRIWAHWNALGRKNSTASLWLNMPFKDNYLNPQGEPYTVVVRDLQNIAKLGYSYDRVPQPDQRNIDPTRDQNLELLFTSRDGTSTDTMQRLKLNTAGMSASAISGLDLRVPLASESIKSAMAPAFVDSQPTEVIALIKDIDLGDNVASVRVFVNRTDLAIHVPDSDPHFVTKLAFLAHPHQAGEEGHAGMPSAVVNLTDTLKNLGELNRVKDDEITLQLVPVPKPGVPLESVGDVVTASVEIAVI